MFSRKFKDAGRTPTSIYLKQFKTGDIVDLVANASQHKGMPHKVGQRSGSHRREGARGEQMC